MIEVNGKRFIDLDERRSKSKKDMENIVETLKKQGKGEINSDVNGSYTGMSADGERPIQDADDL